ncbi:glycosyltransferase family 4 protein [Bacteroidota bacterium]
MIDKENILLILKLPPPVNGATTMNRYIYKSVLINSSFNCFYIDYGLAKDNTDFGTFRFNKLVKYLRVIFTLLFFLIKRKIKLVYIVVAPKGIGFLKDSLFVLISKIFRTKVLIHLQGKGIYNTAVNSNHWKIYYRFIFSKSRVICLTPTLIKDLEDIYNETPYIIPNGIEITDYSDVSPIKGLNQPIILFLSNLYTSKGLVDFIDSVVMLKNQTAIEFLALIIGNETKEFSGKEIAELIHTKGASNYISYLGPKTGHEKHRYLKSATIFVFPTFWPNETFGIVNIEAMEAGLPIITTNEGGIADIVQNGINGFIVKKQSPQEIVDHLLQLLTDKNLYSQISMNNILEFKEKYTINIFEKNMINAIKTTINETGYSTA